MNYILNLLIQRRKTQFYKLGFEDGSKGVVTNRPTNLLHLQYAADYEEGHAAGKKAVPAASANKHIISFD